MLRNILLTLEFDGSDFAGWQIQPGQRTVQGELVATLQRMFKDPEIRVTGSGRTDSGVHALGMGASFYLSHSIPIKGLVLGLNSQLPSDMIVIDGREVPAEFSARKWAQGKRYRYVLWNSPFPSALMRKRAWYIHQTLDVDKMYEASRYLLGRHDFTSFRASGCSAAHPIRDIYEISIAKEGNQISIEYEGSAFLRHMVRNLTGALVEVGKGIQPPEWIGELLEAKDRRKGAITAPPQGLYLVAVNYKLPPSKDKIY